MTTYTYKDLGTLGGTESYATCLVDETHVGASSQPSGSSLFHAATVSWDGTTLTWADLGTLGTGDQSYSRGINLNGSLTHVTGYSRITAGGNYHAFK